MEKVTSILILVAALLGFNAGLGCSGKGPAPAGANEIAALAQKLPEGSTVLDALNKKDYETAVSTLAKMQQAIPESEQLGDFAQLKMHVKNVLIDASAADPKAAEALSSLRFLTQGR